MNVTMTMDEYQSLVNGTQIKSEKQKQAEEAHNKEFQKGQKAIEMLYKVERALQRKGLSITHDGFEVRIV